MNGNKKYRKITSIAASVAILVSSCFQPIPIEKPVLSEEKMIAILKDVHVAEALLTETADKRIKDSLARIYYPQIFHIHQVSPEDFDQSMNAYFTNPAALDSIYTKVIKLTSIEKKDLLDGKGKKTLPKEK